MFFGCAETAATPKGKLAWIESGHSYDVRCKWFVSSLNWLLHGDIQMSLLV